MKLRSLLVATAALSAMASAALSACGGDTTADPATSDAGTSKTDASTGPVDDGDSGTGTDPDADAAPTCDTTKDLLADVPDADIADGASNTSVCSQCAKANCTPQLAACSKDCLCQEAAGASLECVNKLTSLLDVQKCAEPFEGQPKATQTRGQNLGQCVLSACQTQCAPGLADSGLGF